MTGSARGDETTPPLVMLSRRDVIVWAGCFVLAAALLVATRFASDDGDSALYAALGARLSEGPASQWIAPEWWGYWNGSGPFIEHPVGVFLPTIALSRIGIPPVQGAYIVGIGCGVAALLLTGAFVSRVVSPADGRVVLILLQLMPLAFLFRIRANHEYPMLVCLLLTLLGLDGVKRSWWWLPVVVLAGTCALLIKGVFVVLIAAGAVLWIVINPTGAPGSRTRSIAASLVTVMAAAAMLWAYDALYLGATGAMFWRPYWLRQIGSATPASPTVAAYAVLRHIWFYVLHLVWLSLPWSAALIAGVWQRRALLAWWRTASDSARRSIGFVLGFALVTIALLSPATRQAERYEFSAAYLVAAVGALFAYHQWPWLAALMRRLDRAIPSLPAILWLALIVGRLVLGPLLPRLP